MAAAMRQYRRLMRSLKKKRSLPWPSRPYSG
jgi:hypothetical protein